MIALAILGAFSLTSDITSDKATYKESSLELDGNVTISNLIGSIKTDRAIIDAKAENLTLQNKVYVLLEDESSIEAESAHLNVQAKKGTLKGEKTPIKYQTKIEGAPLCITSETASFLFDLGKLTSLEASNNVSIQYKTGFHCFADRAKLLTTPTYVIEASSEKTPCKFTNEQSVIYSEKAVMYINTSDIQLEKVYGDLFNSLHGESEKIAFVADSLTFNEKSQDLSLFGNISLKSHSLGHITAKEQMSILQKENFGRVVLNAIKILGDSTIKHQTHTLHSSGTVTFDRENLYVEATSDGVTPICYENEDITIYAKRALIEYSLVALELKPSLVILSGDVQITLNKENTYRYAIADKVNIDPISKDITLEAYKNSKVLFLDESEGIRVTASKITIDKNHLIKGIGIVKFNFTPSEQELMKNLFPNLRSKKNDS